mmetsp:Transcript_64748/g.146065  ORF Transcript_64748/g.146065 Transcript_64748/m.146065 type:complete len:212 (-) Transcript_64748:281-916(-)
MLPLAPLPRPRLCRAYPDMLEVGCRHGPGGSKDPGLSLAETRSHFGAWCIVSSPLILSHDVNLADDQLADQVWSVIANPDAIRVNQAWAGHAGSPFKRSTRNVTLPYDPTPPESQAAQQALSYGRGSSPRVASDRGGGTAGLDSRARARRAARGHVTAAWQYFHKPLKRAREGSAYSSVAVLLMNQVLAPPPLPTPRLGSCNQKKSLALEA